MQNTREPAPAQQPPTPCRRCAIISTPAGTPIAVVGYFERGTFAFHPGTVDSRLPRLPNSNGHVYLMANIDGFGVTSACLCGDQWRFPGETVGEHYVNPEAR